MNFKHLVVGLAFLLLAVSVNATELGVNYYHETLMSPASHGPYIKRSLSEVGQDFDNIKTISNNVKLYQNPFVDGNLEWIQQVAGAGKQRGMRVVVNMMVDDRYLTDANWQDYSSRVVASCQALSGKVDEVLVGNEITLHSPLSREDIRDRVIKLMGECDNVFAGDVSYEEFWYAKDVWKGHNVRLYWMQYEGLDAFRNNVQEMDSSWGSNALIGEWGEDQLEDHIRFDEQWQKEQIRQRWEIIQSTRTPIAYIFTYREPNDEAFGIIRGDGSRRPLWDVFTGGTTAAPTQPVQQPAPEPAPAPQPEPVVQPAPAPVQEPVAQPTEPGPLPVELPAQQPVEQPVQQPIEQPAPQPIEPTPPAVEQPAAQPTQPVAPTAPTIADTPTQQPTSEPVTEQTQQPAPQPSAQQASEPIQQASVPSGGGGGGYVPAPAIALDELPLTCAAHDQCTIVQDTYDDSCRRITFRTESADINILGCDKRDGSVEIYALDPMNIPFAACLGNGCVSNERGFARFWPSE